ncbi:hypothetical protein SEA_FROGHOPPER_82 [Mycobacterium phage Froghopper]|nr:hypothetical protein SEA_FROGHOPPER_82 [Mycobacterium phage Froghopper]
MRAHRGVPAAAQPTQRAHPQPHTHSPACQLPAAHACPARTPRPAYPLPPARAAPSCTPTPHPALPTPCTPHPLLPTAPLPVRRPVRSMRQCRGTEDAYGLDAASTADAMRLGIDGAPHRGDG